MVNPRDVLIDESKQADIENLGDCLRVLGDGQSLGDFSLTIALYAEDKRVLDRVLPDIVRICRWNAFLGNLQSTQRLFRHHSRQLSAQPSQALPPELQLRRHLVLVHNTSRWLRDQLVRRALAFPPLVAPSPKLRPVGGRLVSFQILQGTRMRC
jgi:hypothetical protein